MKRFPLAGGLQIAVGFLLTLLLPLACSSQQKNGFDLRHSLVPVENIRSGGPPKDGIPALTDPKMVPVSEASYLDPKNLVIGVELNGEARAYPLRIMTHHENVNDTVGDVPVAVVY